MRTKVLPNTRPHLFDREQEPVSENGIHFHPEQKLLPEILCITTFPPRECGIATYSQDLIKALNYKFSQSFTVNICPLESAHEQHEYPDDITYILNTDHPNSFVRLAQAIQDDDAIQIVMIQHEFGFFEGKEQHLKQFIDDLNKPVVMVFHTVLPQPDTFLKAHIQHLAYVCESVVVMTHSSAEVLLRDYGIPPEKITVIMHGTHLVPHSDKDLLKYKYKLSGKSVLTTFGLLSSGKSIETTLEALPAIIKKNPDVLFLIIGKTHPTVFKQEGEKYRSMLEAKIVDLALSPYVQFINNFLPLPTLLEYLQLTDVYLFTSNNPNQAVSGTFSYAASCGCPIVSTPIPHAREVLRDDTGIIIDFNKPKQLAQAVNNLLSNEVMRKNISSNGLHKMASTAWENAAIAHAMLFEKISNPHLSLYYDLPAINLDHIKKMSTEFGILQFSKINEPDYDSGYTLDDNARAMIAMCQLYELTQDKTILNLINIYLDFINYCLQSEGYFLNYVDDSGNFTEQNNSSNLADSNGRAIWALGYLISISDLLPEEYQFIEKEAELILESTLQNVHKIHSTRAMSFIIKGLYYRNLRNKSRQNKDIISELASRLIQMFKHESDKGWSWFESYLTYANSILPEALLCAWMVTNELVYKEVAKLSFDFLLMKTFKQNNIKVISNKGWFYKDREPTPTPIGGEQPIDVAYTILALSKFYKVFKDENYKHKMTKAFDWFLGGNHLHQIIYNPCTGGCYDGLEENYVNLNQGAESTVSYLMARLTIEKSHQLDKKNTLTKNALSEIDSVKDVMLK